MGIHTYPCPTCYATQRVKAPPGEIVQIEDCAACAQAKATDKEVNDALDRYAQKRRS